MAGIHPAILAIIGICILLLLNQISDLESLQPFEKVRPDVASSNSILRNINEVRSNHTRILTQSNEPEVNTLNKKRKKAHKQTYVPYSEAENVVKKGSTTWGEFITFAPQPVRTKPYIKSSIIKAFQQCPLPTVAAPACKEVDCTRSLYRPMF